MIDFSKFPAQVSSPPYRGWNVSVRESTLDQSTEAFHFSLVKIGSVNNVDFYDYSHTSLSMHKRVPKDTIERFFYNRHYLAVSTSDELQIPNTLSRPYKSALYDRDSLIKSMAGTVKSIGIMPSDTITWSPTKFHTKEAMRYSIAHPHGKPSRLVMPSLSYVDNKGNILAIPYQTLFKSYRPKQEPVDIGKWMSCMYYAITKAIYHTDEAQNRLAAAEIWLPSLVVSSTYAHGMVMDDKDLDRGVYPFRMNRFSDYKAMNRNGNTLLVSVNGKSVDGHTQVIKVTYDAVASTVLIEAEVSHWNKRGHTFRKYYDANDRESIGQALNSLAFLLRNGLASVASVKKYRNSLKENQ